MKSTISSRPKVFDALGGRVFQYPLEVHGFYRKWRDLVYLTLIIVFLALPWVRVGGEQFVLLNIPARQFTIFGVKFWAHDAPMLFFVFGGFALGLIFVTAIWGRVWCGWACPQTVFIDGVFRRIEKWIEGTAPQRKLLDQSPWTLTKFRKRLLKHLAFLAVVLVITHSFLAYFVGSDRITAMVLRPPSENWTSFLFILVTSAVLYFNFAWFREQFCIIMCPYGRLQSALFDSSTMIVGYDEARNDCVKCNKCVNVCPTGIDIRHGVQLECIACTACMDACDEIMAKVKKPLGLIRYTSEDELGGQSVSKLRPRTLLYAAFLLVLLGSFLFVLSNRKALDLRVIKTELQVKAEPSSPSIFRYSLEVSNHSFVPKKLRLNPRALPGQELQFEMITAVNPVTVPPGKVQQVDFFLKLSDNRIELPPVELQVGVDGEDTDIRVALYRP